MSHILTYVFIIPVQPVRLAGMQRAYAHALHSVKQHQRAGYNNIMPLCKQRMAAARPVPRFVQLLESSSILSRVSNVDSTACSSYSSSPSDSAASVVIVPPTPIQSVILMRGKRNSPSHALNTASRMDSYDPSDSLSHISFARTQPIGALTANPSEISWHDPPPRSIRPQSGLSAMPAPMRANVASSSPESTRTGIISPARARKRSRLPNLASLTALVAYA